MKVYIILIIAISSAISCFGQKKDDEPTSYKDDIAIAWKNHKDTLQLVVKNKLLTSIQLYFTSRKDSTQLQSFLLPPKDSITLVKYAGKLADSTYKSTFNDSIRLNYFWGHASVITPDLEYAYSFPFKKGKKYRVSQSFNGKFSHNRQPSKYAIDFQLEVGEPVHAARGGVVVKVIDWFTKQGGKELRKAANRIVILHPDGTLGSYVHLQYKGSYVKEGETVTEGQKIGISGLTGYTRGPHLHFVVRKENDIAIPIYFKGYKGKILKPGKKYQIIE